MYLWPRLLTVLGVGPLLSGAKTTKLQWGSQVLVVHLQHGILPLPGEKIVNGAHRGAEPALVEADVLTIRRLEDRAGP